MLIRIEGRDLPGRACGAAGDFPGYSGIHVGVQRKDRPGELLDVQPGDAPLAEWTLTCTVTATDSGIDVKGPYVQGRPGNRFVYLSWGSVDDAGQFTMFRRAKLMFDDIPADVLAAAARSGLLRARLGLTDAKGNPICAHLRPPLVEWSADHEPLPSDQSSRSPSPAR